jgi:hypothetical protein
VQLSGDPTGAGELQGGEAVDARDLYHIVVYVREGGREVGEGGDQ